jgi:hypothetical protein
MFFFKKKIIVAGCGLELICAEIILIAETQPLLEKIPKDAVETILASRC